MAQNYSKKKNLIRSPDEYTRYYGDFRGVDFSSDHTNVHDQRLAYAINMYKDYRAGEGNAIETVPGYRRRFQVPRTNNGGEEGYEKINGIHEFEDVNSDGIRDIIVHAGTHLYLWENYPESVNVLLQKTRQIPSDGSALDIDFTCSRIKSVVVDQAIIPDGFTLSDDKSSLTFGEAFADHLGKFVLINYYEAEQAFSDAIYDDMADSESKSFVFNNRLYILDGAHYLVVKRDGADISVQSVSESAYVPATYKGLTLGEIAPEDLSEFEYEQKNLLTNQYKHTYIAREGVKDYPLYDSGDPVAVTVYGTSTTDYTVEGKVLTFGEAPKPPTEMNYPETYAGVEITYTKGESRSSLIENCTVFATFDKRVFVTGNPAYPNHIWYCGINNATGYEDPTYFGELNVIIDGVENAPITGLIAVADTLAAVKNNTRQDGSVYFHRRMETNESMVPVTYPSEPGLSGIGCLGACVNFLDDPIFISRLGVEAIGQLSVRLERAVEHRSSLIDTKLTNLNLANARVAEWDGYLVVLVDGKIFLADSRQRYTHDTGVMQYEWYYLENIGIYEGQYNEYYYAPVRYDFLPEEITIGEEKYPVDIATNVYNSDLMIAENLVHSAVRLHSYDYELKKPEIKKEIIADTEGREYLLNYVLKYTWDGKNYDANGNPILVEKAIICEDRGSFTGGTFYPAKKIAHIHDNIFFGTDNGIVCSFNFDKRKEDGSIPNTQYSFDNRTIYCGIATKMDNCGVPHLTKSTIKKSTVIKTKSMASAVAKVKVRTNKKGYESLARVNSQIFDFDNIDFSDFSFAADGQSIFAIKEKEKHWVEKQHWIYSDEYTKPFSVNYIAFRYKISGRIKG